MAQRLLILKQDQTVVPALQTMARSSKDPDARVHAVWTLEGLGALDAPLVRELLKDPSPRIRVHALRASETLYKAGDTSLAGDYRTAVNDTDVDVVIQGMLTLDVLKVPDAGRLIKKLVEGSQSRGVKAIGAMLLAPPAATPASASTLLPEQQAQIQKGGTIYSELCFECHGSDGRGAPLAGAPAGTTMAPPLAGSPRVQGHRDYVIKALLNGLTGPLAGKSYTQVMIPLGAQNDEWIAAVASYVRNTFGNTGTFVSPADVARVRAASATRTSVWTQPELEASLPVLLQPQPTWKLTASDNAAGAAGALTTFAWSSIAPQKAGMWFQLELPEPAIITELQLDAAAGGRAGGGAATRPLPPVGAAPAAPPPPRPVPGFPRQYQVQLSMDGSSWGAPVATGQGAPLTVVALPPTRARFVRMTQTGSGADAPAWVIQNLRVYTAPTAGR